MFSSARSLRRMSGVSMQMRKLAIGLFVCASLLPAGCVTQSSPQIYRGSYFYNFESSSFTPAGSDETWCVDSAEMVKAQLPSAQSGTAEVIVQGSLGPKVITAVSALPGMCSRSTRFCPSPT